MEKAIENDENKIYLGIFQSSFFGDHYLIFEVDEHDDVLIYQSFEDVYHLQKSLNFPKKFTKKDFFKNIKELMNQENQKNAIRNLFCYDEFTSLKIKDIFSKIKTCNYVVSYFLLPRRTLTKYKMDIENAKEKNQIQFFEEKITLETAEISFQFINLNQFQKKNIPVKGIKDLYTDYKEENEIKDESLRGRRCIGSKCSIFKK